EAQRRPAALLQRPTLLLPPAGPDDTGPLGDEDLGDALPDPAGCTRHDGDFPVELAHDVLLLSARRAVGSERGAPGARGRAGTLAHHRHHCCGIGSSGVPGERCPSLEGYVRVQQVTRETPRRANVPTLSSRSIKPAPVDSWWGGGVPDWESGRWRSSS